MRVEGREVRGGCRVAAQHLQYLFSFPLFLVTQTVEVMAKWDSKQNNFQKEMKKGFFFSRRELFFSSEKEMIFVRKREKV